MRRSRDSVNTIDFSDFHKRGILNPIFLHLLNGAGSRWATIWKFPSPLSSPNQPLVSPPPSSQEKESQNDVGHRPVSNPQERELQSFEKY